MNLDELSDTKKSVTQLRAEVEKLREDYTKWKADHLNSQDEKIINKFLLIKAELKKRKKSLPFKETDLDLEAKMLSEIAKIKTLPIIPTEHTFRESSLQRPHKCKYCSKSATLAIVWAEGRAFIPVCDNHKEKAIYQIEKINHDKVKEILPLPEKDAEYAPVGPSGEKLGTVIQLKDIEPYFKDFEVCDPVSWIVGGIITHPEGTKNDADILLTIPSEEELKRIIEFRIHRMFPKNLQNRLQLLTEEKGGMSPFTSYLPLYRLIMERIPDAEIVKMEELDVGELDVKAEIKLRTKNTNKQQAEANKAAKNDKVTFNEFILAMKPKRGFLPGQAQSLESFLSLWTDDQFPVYCFHRDTIVWGKKFKKIQEIQIGDKVYSKSGKLQEVLGIFSTIDDRSLRKIKLLNQQDPLICSADHKFLAIKSQKCSWSNRKHLVCRKNCGEQKYGCQHRYKNYKAKWIEANSLETGDFLAIPKIRNQIKKFSFNFAKISGLKSLTRGKGYIQKNEVIDFFNFRIHGESDLYRLFGLYLAEGDAGGGKGIGFSFGLHETDLIEETSYLCEKYFRSPKIYYLDHACRIQLNSTVLSRAFAKLFNTGARNKKIPDFVFHLSKEQLLAFLYGYWRGDGALHASGFRFSTHSETIANQLLVLLNQLNLLAVKYRTSPKSFELNGYKSSSLGGWEVVVTGKQIERIKWPEIKDPPLRSYQKWWDDEEYFWIPILDIEFLSRNKEELFNIQTEDESYIPGVIAHNSSRKADGINTEWHISKDGKVIVYTEDGVDETSSFPQTIEEAKKLSPGHDMILLAEAEWWEDGQHYPREVAAGNIHKINPNEDGIILNVYDMIFYDKDIHKNPFEERRELLQKLNFPQKTELPDPKHNWNLIPHTKNENREELKKETERLRKLDGSEGNVAKQASSSYDLKNRRKNLWIKYHVSTIFTATVLNSLETKTKEVYNLEYGILAGNRVIEEKDTREINGKKAVHVGKSFSTKENPAEGSGILIEAETINVTYDARSKTFDLSAWAPRMLGITNKKPQTIDEIERQAIKDHVFQAKIIDKKGKIHYLPGKSGEEVVSK